ncbi:MAG: rod shape-determining protein MreD [Bacteroidetes bacterium]|jgi:rod shape-determining protein MreD|nr:rod shape-determining protein MreD [Bacteroidota bacterium]
MINKIPRNIIRFALLALIQVFVLNNIRLGGYINPQFYIIFILLLPFETPGWVLLTVSLLLGITIDLFTFTYGFHALSCLIMAFARPFILDIFAPRDGYEKGTLPRVYYYGFNWFLKYAVVLIFIHHVSLFYIEMYRFTEFFRTFLKVLMSTSVSTIFIVASQYLVFRK